MSSDDIKETAGFTYILPKNILKKFIIVYITLVVKQNIHTIPTVIHHQQQQNKP